MEWQPDAERMHRDALAQVQLERLEATLSRVARNVPFYRRRFAEIGFDPDDLRSVEDLQRLPFTTKADVRENHPYGLFAVPLRDVVRVHASSGTTGLSTAVGYTRNDLATWSNLVARVLVAGGVTRDDVVQVSFDYGLFTGAFGFHHGAERIGASVIPVSGASAARQVGILRDYRSTVLVGTPTDALCLADALIEAGVSPGALALRYGLFGAEPWSESVRRELQEKLHVVATDNYGLSEVMGPGVAGECLERNGLHLNEDHFLVEVIDPETLRPAPPGTVGELVITTLTREASPVVRFRTRDLASIDASPCPCGRTLTRMSRVKGRTDDLLILKGVKVFPSEIEHVLLEVEGTAPHYQIVLERRGGAEEATLRVEASPEVPWDAPRHIVELRDAIQRRLAAELGIALEVEMVARDTLDRAKGKSRRVVDRRPGA